MEQLQHQKRKIQTQELRLYEIYSKIQNETKDALKSKELILTLTVELSQLLQEKQSLLQEISQLKEIENDLLIKDGQSIQVRKYLGFRSFFLLSYHFIIFIIFRIEPD